MTVILSTATPSATFHYTPGSSGAKTLTATNDGGLTDPAPKTYTANPTGPVLTRYAGNPIINYGGGGWKASQVQSPIVFIDPSDSSKLIMIFTAMAAPVSSGTQAIGIAVANVSDPYTWTECAANPFINIGTAGCWAADVVLPSSLGAAISVLVANLNTQKIDIYQSSNLTAANALAGTTTFTNAVPNALSPVAPETSVWYPSVILDDPTHLYMAHAYDTTGFNHHMRVATSPSGVVWTENMTDILNYGAAGSFDSTAHEGGQFFKLSGVYLLLYNAYNGPYPGLDAGARWTLGMAKSGSPTTGWIKNIMVTNPIFSGSGVAGTPDRFHVSTGYWVLIGTTWYLYYQGSANDPAVTNFTNANWSMCVATLNAGYSPLDFSGTIITATTYTLTGPSSAYIGVVSTPFTVALPAGTTVGSPVTVTPSDGGGGGTFTPTSVILTGGAPLQTFTYTPVSAGTKTISVTNSSTLTNPANLSVVVPALLTDGSSVSAWPDISGLHNDATATGAARPIFKAAIVGGKPVVRYTSAAASVLNLTNLISGDWPFEIFAVMKVTSNVARLFSLIGNTPTTQLPLGPLENSDGELYGADRAGYLNDNHYYGAAWHVFTYTAPVTTPAGTIDTLRLDGTLISTAVPIASVNTGYFAQLGQGDGDLAEVIIYNNVPVLANIQNIEKYLGTKYGITVAGGTAGDPSTLPGLVGWWKADILG